MFRSPQIEVKNWFHEECTKHFQTLLALWRDPEVYDTVKSGDQFSQLELQTVIYLLRVAAETNFKLSTDELMQIVKVSTMSKNDFASIIFAEDRYCKQFKFEELLSLFQSHSKIAEALEVSSAFKEMIRVGLVKRENATVIVGSRLLKILEVWQLIQLIEYHPDLASVLIINDDIARKLSTPATVTSLMGRALINIFVAVALLRSTLVEALSDLQIQDLQKAHPSLNRDCRAIAAVRNQQREVTEKAVETKKIKAIPMEIDDNERIIPQGLKVVYKRLHMSSLYADSDPRCGRFEFDTLVFVFDSKISAKAFREHYYSANGQKPSIRLSDDFHYDEKEEFEHRLYLEVLNSMLYHKILTDRDNRGNQHESLVFEELSKYVNLTGIPQEYRGYKNAIIPAADLERCYLAGQKKAPEALTNYTESTAIMFSSVMSRHSSAEHKNEGEDVAQAGIVPA